MNLKLHTDMKVKYFTPDIFELDNLMSDPPIIRAGQLVQAYMWIELVNSIRFIYHITLFQSLKILISLGKNAVWKQQRLVEIKKTTRAILERGY